MKYILLTCSFILSTGLFAQKDTTITYYNYNWQKAKKKKASFYQKSFQLADGSWGVKKYRVNGMLLSSGEFKDDEFTIENGHFCYYNEWVGYKTEEGDYSSGQKTGLWTTFFDDGQKKSEQVYDQGVPEGEYKEWDSSGSLILTGQYESGKKTGEWIERASNGTITEKGNYINDQKDGEWTGWFDNGKVSYMGRYDYGEKIGEWQHWYRDGNVSDKGRYDSGDKTGEWQSWYSNGQLSSLGKYVKGKRSGNWQQWYRDGQKNEVGEYVEGERDGKWEFYFDSGRMSAMVQFDTGKALDVQFWNEEGEKVPYDGGALEIDPVYPGGERAMFEFVMKNIQYPQIARDYGIQGTVYVQFVIDSDGSVTDVKAIRSPSEELSKEAIRIIELMPKWNPGISYNRYVRVRYTLPINFRLG